MNRLLPVALGISMLCAGCATAPPRVPVAPEPGLPLQSAECASLGLVDFDPPIPKFYRQPYGWALLRIDVERGVVVNAQVLDASPKQLFDAEVLAIVKSRRFPSLATARGCAWSHKWG
jgi:hypothetical protein